MFKTANPYDEPVTKATDENLTSEDWEANLDVCDKVSGEGEQGARNCVAAIQKRLAHRSANVQLYALILTDALSKNAGVNAHREIASRSFSQTLIRLATDRNTHESVKQKTYALVKEWSQEYGTDPDLGIIAETYSTLQKQLGSRFEESNEPEPVEPSTDLLRQEDEELRRVLELSVHDQGGRQAWMNEYSYAQTGAGAGGSSSGAQPAASNPSALAGVAAAAGAAAGSHSNNVNSSAPAGPVSSGSGPSAPSQAVNRIASVAPAHSVSNVAPATNGSSTVPSINVQDATAPNSAASTLPPSATAASAPSNATTPAAATTAGASTGTAATAASSSTPTVSRVRALYDFKPSESGELGFQKGDVIRVLYAVYDHWWRGELRGDIGIFPVNYVEILPDPTPADLQREAEMEARVFAQAENIDSLLNKLKDLDPTKDNLAEDEELQELYQVSLSMRPKIIRLIDRYSAKITELKAMNDKFVRARGTFDRLMEESLAKYNPGVQSNAYTQVRPEYAGAVASAGAQNAVPQQQAYGQYAVQAGAQGQQPQAGHPQQQQDYAKAWAEWYAQNGYPEQAAQAAAAAAAAAAGQPYELPQQQVQHQQQFAQQYGGAQPQQPIQSQSAVPGQPLSHLAQQAGPEANGATSHQYGAQWAPNQASSAAAGSSGAGTSGSAPLPTPAGGPVGQQAPQDDEKRRLYERARAEAEAFQRQGGNADPYGVYQQQQGSSSSGGGQAGGSGSGAPAAQASGVTAGVANMSLV
ncbi:hypothetical protein OC845_000305 [Tilletia horrida]|nr:hypothetical protein OC845_000305 [Tilletia horrida]